jgi:hypothetical protein
LVLGSFSVVAAGVISLDTFREIMTALFTPVLGVFGTVTGFYYGTHASDQK